MTTPTTIPEFTATIDNVDTLSELYRPPSEVVQNKDTVVLDQGCRDFIAQSTFVVVGTSNTDGQLDTSPRGGPAGFVKVIDEHRLVIPDLNGNNRLDTIRNIIEQGQVALLFIIPGLGETLRVNGTACITTDDAVLDLFTDELRRPKTAIGVTLDHGFIHCAKAFRRGGLWEPTEWPAAAARPSPGQMLVDHAELDGVSGADIDSRLNAGYEADLAQDLPE